MQWFCPEQDQSRRQWRRHCTALFSLWSVSLVRTHSRSAVWNYENTHCIYIYVYKEKEQRPVLTAADAHLVCDQTLQTAHDNPSVCRKCFRVLYQFMKNWTGKAKCFCLGFFWRLIDDVQTAVKVTGQGRRLWLKMKSKSRDRSDGSMCSTPIQTAGRQVS